MPLSCPKAHENSIGKAVNPIAAFSAGLTPRGRLLSQNTMGIVAGFAHFVKHLFMSAPFILRVDGRL